jgi:hypothetical protein
MRQNHEAKALGIKMEAHLFLGRLHPRVYLNSNKSTYAYIQKKLQYAFATTTFNLPNATVFGIKISIVLTTQRVMHDAFSFSFFHSCLWLTSANPGLGQ